MVAAQRMLQGDEFRVWRMDITEYVQQIAKTGDKELLRELNVLAMRSRITRLDKLRGDTLVELSKLSTKVEKAISKFLPSAYKDFYYHGLYEIGKKAQIAIPANVLDPKRLENTLHIPWSGKNYSERIWHNNAKLGQTIQQTMVTAMHRGSSLRDLSRYVADRMNVGIHDAERLVQTELNYVQNKAALDSIKDAGMKYYRFIATLDSRTTVICREHDGRTFAVDDADVGYNMPPLHPRCRSTISGCLRALKDKPLGERIARDTETGKTYYVQAGMKYEEWKSVYVDKKISLDAWKQMHGSSIIKIGILRTTADPMLEVTGAAEDSNPEEITAFMHELESYGVILRRPEEETLAYGPNPVPGLPGEVIISKGASFSAWVHEMTHVRDDFADGWPGFRIFADLKKVYERERHAYKQEIKLAEKLPEPVRSEMILRLKENLEKERKVIYHEVE